MIRSWRSDLLNLDLFNFERRNVVWKFSLEKL